MGNIACETGNLLNDMFNFIGANSFMGSRRTYKYIVTIILGLSLPGTTGKAVYGVVKDK
jgi:hypothetical protein